MSVGSDKIVAGTRIERVKSSANGAEPPDPLASVRAAIRADLEAGPEAVDAALPPEFVQYPHLPKCGANTCAPGETGKTSLALCEKIRVACEMPLYPFAEVQDQGPCVLVTAEDGADRARYVLQRALADGVENRQITERHAELAPLDIHGKPEFAGLPAATALPGRVWRLEAGTRVESLDGFDDGTWWVQDFAATLPARLFGEISDARVLDLCAAPGGKTAALAACGAKVTALERDPVRLARLATNLTRLGLVVGQICADLRDWNGTEPYSLVLLDAPRSAT